MPLVWKVIPDLKVNIIGSYITDEIEALASDKFKLLGFVDDLNAVINTTKLFVAPLRFGAGIKGKIGQSLEHSLPLVTTNVGAEGFDFGEQTNVMIANNAEAIAQKVIDLYTNKILWEEASNSCKTILEPFSLKVTENQVLQII